MKQAARLIGIDPGLRFTGWGVIDVSGNRLTHVADGAKFIAAVSGGWPKILSNLKSLLETGNLALETKV